MRKKRVEKKVMEDGLDGLLEGVKGYREQVIEMRELIRVLKEKDRPDDVFGEFAGVAAKLLVLEMLAGDSGKNRLAAIAMVLDRGLGKVVDRSITLNHELVNMGDEEIEGKIEELLSELKIGKDKERDVIKGFIEVKAESGCESAEVVPAASGVSGEVRKVVGED